MSGVILFVLPLAFGGGAGISRESSELFCERLADASVMTFWEWLIVVIANRKKDL